MSELVQSMACLYCKLFSLLIDNVKLFWRKKDTGNKSLFFLIPFLSSSGTPIILMLLHLMLSQRSLRLFSFLFILFSLICSASVFPPFNLLAHLSILLPHLFSCRFLLGMFFTSVIVSSHSGCYLL